MFSFKYSPRPNTLAIKRLPDDVSESDKTARIVALQSLQREIQTQIHERAVGSLVDVLIDSTSRRRDSEISGRTTGNTVVNCIVPGGAGLSQQDEASLVELGGRIPASGAASQWIGHTVAARIHRAGPHSLWGEVVASDVRGRVSHVD
jgi:tRNA A37 methylthiotransferase MiaB